MLRPLSTVVFAAAIWAAALALPAQAKDSETVPAPAASSSDITSRAQAATPAVKRVRKASAQPRRVAVASSAPYHPQCFLFWCTGGGRPFHFLVLGVAY
jgi:hypothetical protein